MTSSSAVYILAFLFAVCLSYYSAAATFDLDDDLGYFQDSDKHSYTEATLDAIRSILKSHAQALRQLESEVYEQKRGGARSRLSGGGGGDEVSIGVKRRMIWQPLGYLPASARVQNSNPEPQRHESQESGSTVFRYG